MPNLLHEKAKPEQQDIRMVATRTKAIVAFFHLVEPNGLKYQTAGKKLTKDQDVVLTF